MLPWYVWMMIGIAAVAILGGLAIVFPSAKEKRERAKRRKELADKEEARKKEQK